MNSLAAVAIAFSFIFALLSSWVLLVPFFSERGVDEPIAGEQLARDTLRLRKEQTLSEIEELEMDRIGGKITDADYQQSRAELTADAADILDRLDRASDVGGVHSVGAQKD